MKALHGREARSAGAAWNIAKTLGHTTLFWSLFLFVLPALFYRLEGALGLAAYRFAAPGWRTAGIVLFALAGSLGLTSGILMAVRGRGTPLPTDCARALVIAGPYRYVRNPMAIAGLAQGAAVGLYLGSPLTLAYVMAGLFAWDWFVRRWEEADLERRFGESYRLYRRRARCWRPRLRPYDPARESEEPPVSAERTTPPGRHVVLFDGKCRFCRAQVQNLLRFAQRDSIEVLSFQDDGVLAQFPGVSYDACLRAMHLIRPDGRVYSGFEAAAQAVATRRGIGWIAYAYYLPFIHFACDTVYALIAANRYRLMGEAAAAGDCEEGTCSQHAAFRRTHHV